MSPLTTRSLFNASSELPGRVRPLPPAMCVSVLGNLVALREYGLRRKKRNNEQTGLRRRRGIDEPVYNNQANDDVKIGRPLSSRQF